MTTTRAIDVSNYSGEISPEQARALYVVGIRRVIVQAVNERVLTHRQQIPVLLTAGFEVEGYVYVWFSADTQFVANRVEWACREFDDFPGVTKRMWLDCEQTALDTPPFDHVNEPVSMHIRTAVDVTTAMGYAPGIYTAEWWWRPGASNSTEWAHLPLWNAEYDGDPETLAVNYGGWTKATMKQYAGTSTVASVPMVDLDAYPELLPNVAAAKMALKEALRLLGE